MSIDAADVHDFAMIAYIVLTLPWMLGSIALTSHRSSARYRKVVCGSFFGALPILIYLYIEHKVRRLPGAYSRYAIFEWSLIFLDIAFDGLAAIDFASIEIRVVDLGARDEKSRRYDA